MTSNEGIINKDLICCYWYVTSILNRLLCFISPRWHLIFFNYLVSMQFNVLPKTIIEIFSIPSMVGGSVITKWVYRGCLILLSNRVTFVDLVEHDMLDVDHFKRGLTTCFFWITECRTHVVKFKTLNEPVVNVTGDPNPYRSNYFMTKSL